MYTRLSRPGIDRRTFLKTTGAAAGAAGLAFPGLVRAQAREIKIGAVHPVTGPLAEKEMVPAPSVQTRPA